MTFLDARIPVFFGAAEEARADDALLMEGDGVAAPGRDWFMPAAETEHPVGCACCTPRSGAGMALSRLMLARGRGSGLFFRRVLVVVVTEAGRAAVVRALQTDALAAGWFRAG
jgi:hypothetical protein